MVVEDESGGVAEGESSSRSSETEGDEVAGGAAQTAPSVRFISPLAIPTAVPAFIEQKAYD